MFADKQFKSGCNGWHVKYWKNMLKGVILLCLALMRPNETIEAIIGVNQFLTFFVCTCCCFKLYFEAKSWSQRTSAGRFLYDPYIGLLRNNCFYAFISVAPPISSRIECKAQSRLRLEFKRWVRFIRALQPALCTHNLLALSGCAPVPIVRAMSLQ